MEEKNVTTEGLVFNSYTYNLQRMLYGVTTILFLNLLNKMQPDSEVLTSKSIAKKTKLKTTTDL